VAAAGFQRAGVLLSAALTLTTAAGVARPEVAAFDVAVRAARLLDPASGQLRGPIVILVTGEPISGIVPANGFDAKSARSVIDLKEATLLPGLTDAHVHLQIGGQPESNALAALQAGFTTLADLGATSDRECEHQFGQSSIPKSSIPKSSIRNRQSPNQQSSIAQSTNQQSAVGNWQSNAGPYFFGESAPRSLSASDPKPDDFSADCSRAA
jgi:hypothetical protein